MTTSCSVCRRTRRPFSSSGWPARVAGEQPEAFEDQAEQRALLDLEALEKRLVEPFRATTALLEAARGRVRGVEE